MAMQDREKLDEPTVLVAMHQISTVWEHLFPTERHRILRLLIERVQLRDDGLDIVWRDDGWQQFRRELEQHPLHLQFHAATACRANKNVLDQYTLLLYDNKFVIMEVWFIPSFISVKKFKKTS